ncbi:MAG: hypothetical protein IH600_06860 [Bacteroidetes bacterium]|nr:hypothetical protein [Bacteroidota bacterium]
MRIASILMLLFVLAAVTSPQLRAQDGEDEYPDASFFVGSYTLIGKVLEGNGTFMGLLILEADSTGRRSFARVIGADTTRGSWNIEYAIGEEVRVIRIRWQREGRKYECTYQWCYDFDSYARLSGHCYESGKATDSPGMEVGFAIWPDWGNDGGNMDDDGNTDDTDRRE